MLRANSSEEKKKERKKKLALLPSSVRRARTAFEKRSPTDYGAAPKSLRCSYCLCCCEYFIRIFQYLFIFFCPCRCLTRPPPFISYILMHRGSACPPSLPPVQPSSINHPVLCTSAKRQRRFKILTHMERKDVRVRSTGRDTR